MSLLNRPKRQHRRALQGVGLLHRHLRFQALEERRLLSIVTWDGGGGDFDWNNPLNWDIDALPGTDDSAVIDLDGTFTVSLSSTVTIASLTLGGGTGAQTLDTTGRTFTINGPAAVTTSGVLRISGPTTADQLTNDGTVELGLNSNLVMANGTLTNSASGTIHRVATGGSAILNADVDNQGAVLVDQDLTIANTGHTFSSTTGTIDIAAGQFLRIGGGTTELAGNALAGDGTAEWTAATIDLPADFTVPAGAHLSLALAASAVTVNGPGTLINNGEVFLTLNDVIESPVDNFGTIHVKFFGNRIRGDYTSEPGSTVDVTGSLSFSKGFVNTGTIVLNPDVGGGAGSVAVGGTFVNGPSGIIRSLADSVFAAISTTSATMENEGTIDLSIGDVSTTGAVINRGLIEIGANQTFRFGDLEITGNGIVTTQPGGVLSPNENRSSSGPNARLGGDTTNPDSIENAAVALPSNSLISLDFEVMSRDAGRSGSLLHNFVLDSLEVNSFMRLIDESDNSSGTDPEALYVRDLIVASGSQLDLNGLHLYAASAQINGSVTGGVVEFIEPEAIELNTFVPGNTVGETDQIPFFGRAGQTVTVDVKTGGTDPDSPIPPTLQSAQVTLTDPDGQVLGTGTNAVPGEDVLLAGVTLPADGVYHVSVAPADPLSLGNYTVGVFDATVDTSRIVFNQSYVGRIEHVFAVDRWTFAAVAGQQVQLDVLDATNPETQFALQGPGGITLFSGLTGDSNLVTLPTDGEYRFGRRRRDRLLQLPDRRDGGDGVDTRCGVRRDGDGGRPSPTLPLAAGDDGKLGHRAALVKP